MDHWRNLGCRWWCDGWEKLTRTKFDIAIYQPYFMQIFHSFVAELIDNFPAGEKEATQKTQQ